MPQINSGKSPPWVSGEIVTAAGLNGMIDSATIDPSAITAQSNLTTLTNNEYALIVDTAGALKKTQLKNINEVGVVTNKILGLTLGTPLTIQPSGSGANDNSLVLYGGSSGGVGLKDGTIQLEAGDILLTAQSPSGLQNSRISFLASNSILFSTPAIDFSGYSRFTTTDAVRVPQGTTSERPAVPASGDLRYNVTTSRLEFHNGSSWSSIATGTITTGTYGLYEIFVQNFQSSTNITNVSSSFSKPSNEIWEFEVDYYPTYNSGDYTYIFKAGGSYWWFTRFNAIVKPAMLTAKWVIQAGTVLTSETVTFDSQVGGGSPKELNRELRIYKYKPATS
jgi:hypothetical protein